MLAEVPGDVREDGHHDVGGGRVGGHLGDEGDDHADDGGHASDGDVLGGTEDCGVGRVKNVRKRVLKKPTSIFF